MTGSAYVTLNPGRASKLTVNEFTSPATAGVAGTVDVVIEDAYGNSVTGYTGTVHFTSSDRKASLPANYTFSTADPGYHFFSATLKTAGTQSITATDTATPSDRLPAGRASRSVANPRQSRRAGRSRRRPTDR
jgi:hypothetical protein